MNEYATAVTLREVSASYGRQEVLRGITAVVPEARVTAIVGPNGAGKSSLLNVIAGVLPTTSGEVATTDSGRPAYVTQHSEVSDTLPITVRAAVTMGRWAHRRPWHRLTRQDREVVEECLARLDITAIAGRRLGTLSGGQRQRALVAQGLAQQSDLLLLDEPSAGLDLQAQARIEDALDEARREGVTVLRVTHDLTAAGRADHCLLLGAGALVAEGPPSTVLTPERVATAWGVPQVR
ncbi:zinc ABC transporter ATP-binding protein AztA [Crossiella sp. NPDC003009]